MAVGCGARHDLRGEVARRAGAVLDDERLAEAFREPRRVGARDEVVRAARREAYHDAHRPRGIRLSDGVEGQHREQHREAEARHSREV